MITTVEGIETEEQLDHVRPLGCAEIQRFLFSPPRSIEEISKLFLARPAAKTSAA
jgi:EAL domain-containing protein (putative c-di-GMP-specific phosphodiesterase class I)